MLGPQAFIAQFVDRSTSELVVHWCPPFLTVFHKYGVSFDNYILISSANIPAELHEVVCPFTRPYFVFSLSNFPMGRGTEGLGMRLGKQYKFIMSHRYTVCSSLSMVVCLSARTAGVN